MTYKFSPEGNNEVVSKLADQYHAIARFTRRQLLDHPNFGKTGCAAIIEWLARHNLHLRASPTESLQNRGRLHKETAQQGLWAAPESRDHRG